LARLARAEAQVVFTRRFRTLLDLFPDPYGTD